MLKKVFFRLLFFFISLSLFAQETKEEALAEMDKISESLGHIIGENLKEMNLEFDVGKISKGIKDSINGKKPPMSEDECIQAISALQKESQKQICDANIKSAEDFLKENSQKEGVYTLLDGKVQYSINTPGTGREIKVTDTPLVKYTCRFLNGIVFKNSEELVNLSEVPQGFALGLQGMKEGEKRSIFIHADAGYKDHPENPGALIIMEVELLKANKPDAEIAEMGKKEVAERKVR